MSLHLKQTEGRSELQQRLDAELRAKAAERARADAERPDGVDDAAFMKHTKQTTSLSWAWALIAAAAMIIFAVFVYITMQG